MVTTSDGQAGRTDRNSAARRAVRELRLAMGSRSARTELAAGPRRQISDALRSLWFKPAMAVAGAVALAAILSPIHVQKGSVAWNFAFQGDSTDARQYLTVVAGTIITVTSLVFALTVVTLQIASTQFSPRLLRTFLRDGGTQFVLGVFVGTEAFSLTGLFTVSTASGSEPPRLTISVALLLALMCVGALVYYIGHITNSIRIDSIMRRVEVDTRRILRRDHPLVEESTAVPDRTILEPAPPHAVTVLAPVGGYVQGADPRLLSLAIRKGLTIRLLPLVGYYVVAGRALAVAWTDDGGPTKPTTRGAIAALIRVTPERRIEREFGLGLRQLVDIVDRAMSTGQNDPYTAAQAVHHLTSLMADASRRSFATEELCDPQGRVRVIVPIMDFPTHLKVVCGHTRQGGLERHPRVTMELLRMLRAVGESAIGEGRVDAVRQQVDITLADSTRVIPTQTDLDEVLELGKEVLETLDHLDANRVAAATV